MKQISDFTITTIELPQAIQETCETLVLSFAWNEGDPTEWMPGRLGLGWSRSGLVLTGVGAEPIIFLAQESTTGHHNDRQHIFDLIDEYKSLLVCAVDKDDNPVAIARFTLKPQDLNQTHFIHLNP